MTTHFMKHQQIEIARWKIKQEGHNLNGGKNFLNKEKKEKR